MKLLCLGDSLTSGYELNSKDTWTNLISMQCKIEVINCGISGDTTAGMLSRSEQLFLKYEPTHLIIFGGTNDLWFGLKDEFILSNIHAIIVRAHYYKIACIVGIPTPSINLNQLNIIRENYSECIRAFKNSLLIFCKDNNHEFIDFSKSMNSKHYLDDGLHPNLKGQKVMACNVKNTISKWL